MILVDAGPLVALLDRRDQHPAACVRTLKNMGEPLGTVWPAVTDAMDLLEGVEGAQDKVGEMIARGAPRILALDEGDIPRIRELMAKYSNRPMDLADAALVRVAERERVATVFTVDKKDFSVYRLHGRSRLRVLP
jgi:predicted nucleic acid-binding protein